MKETTEIKEIIEQEAEKPYTFRKLSSDDLFLMIAIIKKIGFKEFKNCFDMELLKEHFKVYQTAKPGEEKEKALLGIGVAIGFDAIDIILGNLPKCKELIYQLLSSVSGMPENKIKADALLLTEMLMDFFKKEEFPAFIKVVSKLFR